MKTLDRKGLSDSVLDLFPISEAIPPMVRMLDSKGDMDLLECALHYHILTTEAYKKSAREKRQEAYSSSSCGVLKVLTLLIGVILPCILGIWGLISMFLNR